MKKIEERLEELLKDFPGVGPRQAKRFLYFLIWKDNNYIKEFTDLLQLLRKNTKKCQSCNRIHFSSQNICETCLDDNRIKEKLLIVEKNSDFENIEKTKLWKGQYFIIGKNLKLTEKEPEQKINLEKLFRKIKENKVQEITFALSLNPEGVNTMEWIKEMLYPLQKEQGFKISELARGISLGSEIEYIDKVTLEEALKNRK